MLWIKRVITSLITVIASLITLTLTRFVAAMGLIGCLFMAFMPVGCTSSIEQASLRYRAQNQNETHLLRDFTVERLQECVETYGKELRHLDPPFAHAKAHIQVSQEGQVVDVQVTGIPDSAPDLAGCTRIALREMTVPESVLSLRQKEASASTTEQTVPRGNELANPIVLWEIGTLFAEFVAENGGRTVLYTVTIEVLSAAAIAAVAVAISRTQKNRCTARFVNCTESPAGRARGNTWNDSRCGTCLKVCIKNKGEWPKTIEMSPEGTVSCY
jgi:hypothetical protein